MAFNTSHLHLLNIIKSFEEAVDNNIIHSFTLPNNGVDKSESKYKNNNGAIIDDKHFDSIMEARFLSFYYVS